MNFEEIKQKDLLNIKHLQPEGWSDIIVEFEFYVNSPFCYPIKVEVNNMIIGIGAAIEFGKTAWLAHIIVDPEHRRRGIGYQIVVELLKYLGHRSIETSILIATEMGLPIYEKAGFRIVNEYTYMKKDKQYNMLNTSDFVIPVKKEFTNVICKMDREVTGENRSWLLAKYLEGSYIYLENNEIKGYYLPNLREGLIIAVNDTAGIELLKLKMPAHDKIVLPSDNLKGIEFLTNNGFIRSETRGTRMIRGKNINWNPKKIFSRIGGNLG
jgi:GNAT superfamily N-acetyltransferase